MSVEHLSHFGGLWTDRRNAQQLLLDKLYEGEVTHQEAKRLRDFIAHGYLVLEQAVPHEVIDRFQEEITRAFKRGDERLLVQEPGTAATVLAPRTPTELKCVVDTYVFYESAREALLADAVVRALTLIFEDAPLLFQSLRAVGGSQYSMHQDTAYVVTSSPLELAGAWVALDNVWPGTGELVYYDGSHRLDDFLFGGDRKHWDPDVDGDEPHRQFLRHVDETPPRRGMTKRTFLPHKGDVMIWAADLVHGVSPVVDPDHLSMSLVGHYCPNRVDPRFFSTAPQRRTKQRHRGGFYASGNYELAGDRPGAVPVEPAQDEDGAHHRARRFSRRIFSWRER